MYLFPAHAGVIPISGASMGLASTFPRTRGGDPYENADYEKDLNFSPHTRG